MHQIWGCFSFALAPGPLNNTLKAFTFLYRKRYSDDANFSQYGTSAAWGPLAPLHSTLHSATGAHLPPTCPAVPAICLLGKVVQRVRSGPGQWRRLPCVSGEDLHPHPAFPMPQAPPRRPRPAIDHYKSLITPIWPLGSDLQSALSSAQDKGPPLLCKLSKRPLQ